MDKQASEACLAVSVDQWNVTRDIVDEPTRRVLAGRWRHIPHTSEERLHRPLNNEAFDLPQLVKSTSADSTVGRSASDTVLYLAYGSNLCAETFLGKRGIRPLSQCNVAVPSLVLTFNLRGVPYKEPCFANTRYLDQPVNEKGSFQTSDYHKDQWHKGLVGVVYEVTKADYAHIVATEGGGSGYHDVMVDCYMLEMDPRLAVPASFATSVAFKAHTLFAPQDESRTMAQQSYAQPSARYLKLITDGATEHNLPYEYQDFLHRIRPFRMTTKMQQTGQFLYALFWTPIIFLVYGGAAKKLLKADGTYPAWVAAVIRFIFAAAWLSYTGIFRPLFGEGERTIGESDQDDDDFAGSGSGDYNNEKAPLIKETISKYGIGGSLDHMV